MPGPFDIIWTLPSGATGGKFALDKEEAAELVRSLGPTARTIDAMLNGKRFATLARDADGDLRVVHPQVRYLPNTPQPIDDDFDLSAFNKRLAGMFSTQPTEAFDLAAVNCRIANIKFN